MGFSKQTPNLALPQFQPTDKPTFQGDINDAFGLIDANAGSLLGQINLLQTELNSLTARVVVLENAINTATTGILARLHALDGK